MRKALCLTILSLLLFSCTSTEYVYVRDEPAELPTLEESIDPALMEEIKRPLDVVMHPETTSDLLKNLSEYQNGYFMYKGYSEALEAYIDRIIAIHNGGTIKDGENDIQEQP